MVYMLYFQHVLNVLAYINLKHAVIVTYLSSHNL